MGQTGDMTILYSPETLDFIQQSMNYLALLDPEVTPRWTRETVRECRNTLAAVYFCASRLPELDPMLFFGDLEHLVQEEDYERVRRRLERFLAEQDLFPDALHESMQFSERPINVSLSELLADIFQELADTVWVYRQQNEETMAQSLAEAKYSFENDWGQKLAAIVRRLHLLLSDPDFMPIEDLEEREEMTDYDE